MQIFPKVMAAINPVRYLKMTGRGFPVVNVIKAIGVSWPAEKPLRPFRTARLASRADPREGTAARPDLADAWAALIP